MRKKVLRRKKFIIILLAILVLMPVSANAVDFYFLGIKSQWIKEANWGHVALGAVSSFTSHIAGHFLYSKLKYMDVEFHGVRETVEEDDYSDSDMRNIARAGFVLQHGINLALRFSSVKDSDFSRGFTIVTALETWTYRLYSRDVGDFQVIDKNGGDGDGEHLFFCALSVIEVIRIEW